MDKSNIPTRYNEGDKVVITPANLIKVMVDKNKSVATHLTLSDGFLEKVRQFLFAENGESNIGTVTHTYPPGYEVAVWFRNQLVTRQFQADPVFHMKDNYITRVDAALPELFGAGTVITLDRYDHDYLFADMLNATSFDGFAFEIPDWEGRTVGDLSRYVAGVRTQVAAAFEEGKKNMSDEEMANMVARSNEIRNEYVATTDGLDADECEAIESLMTECGKLFQDKNAAWSFLMDDFQERGWNLRNWKPGEPVPEPSKSSDKTRQRP